ncbi:MAG: rod shape-determining protein RodA [Deferribacteres bacterium]|nr:rod shape-determining protein RodA [Deferribacteres bacterium]
MRVNKGILSKRLDLGVVFVFFLISAIGLFTLAGIYEGSIFLKRQILWHVIGIAAFLGVLSFDRKFFREWVWFFYIGAIALLIMVLIVGKVGKGAQRWIIIGPFRLQPSEFAKIALALALGSVFEHFSVKGRIPLGLREVLIVGAVCLPFFILTAMQPDLGTALIFVLVAATVSFFAGIKRGTLVLCLLFAFVVAFVGWNHLKPYQKNRIIAFLDPKKDPYRTGYHIIQSRIAIGSGRLWGKGYMKGTQSRLNFIPEKHTDFIFPTFAEDWGFIGVCVLLFLYFVFITRIIEICKRAKNPYALYTTVALGAIFFWHIVINVGMTMGLLPVVGVPLPLMSYGGSATVASYITLGLILVMVRE